jgi:hypothetical protein
LINNRKSIEIQLRSQPYRYSPSEDEKEEEKKIVEPLSEQRRKLIRRKKVVRLVSLRAAEKLFMPGSTRLSLGPLSASLNNLMVLSHCHYAKLYSFHFITNMCGWDGGSGKRVGLSDYYFCWHQAVGEGRRKQEKNHQTAASNFCPGSV